MKATRWAGLILCFLLAMPVQAAEPKSALLMDAATGTVLYESNAHEALAPASVTKVMTLLLIMEAVDSGRIGWEDTVTASETAAAKGGSQVYLKVGETMTVSDMVKSIAVSSANDCACAMAEHLAGSETAFVELMNKRAADLGMNDTHFVNCTGLDDDPAAKSHRTSAHDIAVMSRELLVNHPDIKNFTTIWMDTIRDGAFGLSNTNKMVRYYPGCTGLKTGFTSGAGYCLSASAQRDGMELIAVVMGAETSQDRFAACKGMLDQGFANYALYSPNIQEGAAVPVTLGQADSVAVIPEQIPRILVERAKLPDVSSEIILSPQADAPIVQGQKLGTLTIRAGEEILAEVNLVAENKVPQLTWGQVTARVLRQVAMAQD
ncbi:MAG: D-alanyl-D-alanine carboxypeptidase [Oscillospiraceae bacterium]|nr:D-alanyl-D-alanine carboxypeptidase [Oscillospiraceae bacterium]